MGGMIILATTKEEQDRLNDLISQRMRSVLYGSEGLPPLSPIPVDEVDVNNEQHEEEVAMSEQSTNTTPLTVSSMQQMINSEFNTTPVATPVASPVSTQATTPVATPVAAPVSAMPAGVPVVTVFLPTDVENRATEPNDEAPTTPTKKTTKSGSKSKKAEVNIDEVASYLVQNHASMEKMHIHESLLTIMGKSSSGVAKSLGMAPGNIILTSIRGGRQLNEKNLNLVLNAFLTDPQIEARPEVKALINKELFLNKAVAEVTVGGSN